MSFADVWSYTSPVRDKFECSRPDVCNDVAAFYVWKNGERRTVEIDRFGFGLYLVWIVENKEEPTATDAKHIRQVLLNLVSDSFNK